MKYKYWLMVAIAPISITLIFYVIPKIWRKMKKKKPTSPDTVPGTDYVLKYFKLSEFDSKGKGEEGSGVNMQKSTLEMLDKARGNANTPFVIRSGYRTAAHNEAEGGVKGSAHTKGYAADITCTDATRDKILKALYNEGFRRFGIGNSYIHADNDPSLPQTVWGYPCKSNSCAPAKYNSLAKIAAL